MSFALNPWQPIQDPAQLKLLGKLGEELNECGAAVSRCIIQGVGECEPVTQKPNKQMLEEEIADVLACAYLVLEHFRLDDHEIYKRVSRKQKHIKAWVAMGDEKL